MTDPLADNIRHAQACMDCPWCAASAFIEHLGEAAHAHLDAMTDQRFYGPGVLMPPVIMPPVQAVHMLATVGAVGAKITPHLPDRHRGRSTSYVLALIRWCHVLLVLHSAGNACREM